MITFARTLRRETVSDGAQLAVSNGTVWIAIIKDRADQGDVRGV